MAAKNGVGQEKSERRTRVGKVAKNWKTGSNRELCRFRQRCEPRNHSSCLISVSWPSPALLVIFDRTGGVRQCSISMTLSIQITVIRLRS
jgi:hypothetical protein